MPWVTLMGSPSITARLPGVVAQRVHAAAGTCITDEHKARGRQRAGATQRGATTSVCASLCQSFVAEVSRGGVLKTQTIFGPQLFKAVNKVFKSTSWFPWYKSFSLTCKAQRKFHPSIPNFYLKRHLGYYLFKKAFRVLTIWGNGDLDKKSHLGRIASNRDRTKCFRIVYFCRKFMQNYTCKPPKMPNLIFCVTFGRLLTSVLDGS